MLLALIHSHTNPTTRALAAPFTTSQPTVDRILHHLVPTLDQTLRPTPDSSHHPSIIDDTLTPAHDQSITANSNNYRRSLNTQINICAHRRRVVVTGRCWPDNRNDVIAAHTTVAHILTGHQILGDGRYRDIPAITAPRRHSTGRIIRDDRYQLHRPIKARVQHVIAPLKDWQTPRQRRPRGQAINHSLHIIAGLCNLKTRNQLRVNS